MNYPSSNIKISSISLYADSIYHMMTILKSIILMIKYNFYLIKSSSHIDKKELSNNSILPHLKTSHILQQM